MARESTRPIAIICDLHTSAPVRHNSAARFAQM
jgi:hypothetical protein